jgi:hypothetical protein
VVVVVGVARVVGVVGVVVGAGVGGRAAAVAKTAAAT